MNTSTSAMTSGVDTKYGAPFWERLWLMSGLNFVLFAVLAYFVYGSQPQVGASAATVLAFYDGSRVRILVAVVISGMAVLNLLWFAAALRTTFADAGRDGWGAAMTASSTAVGVLFLLLVSVCAMLAYSIAGTHNGAIASGLNDFVWGAWVLSSFPRAMLIMSGSFGLWRAGLISNGKFAAGVVALVLVLLGGTTWISGGFWAPDGAYSRFVSPVIGLAWVLAVSRVVLTRNPTSRPAW
jgi:hypothetical protein